MRKMTPRERVLAAARREAVDRIPLFLWLEPHTTVRIASEVERPKRMLDRVFFDRLARLREVLPSEELRNGVELLAALGQTEFVRQLGSDIVIFNAQATPLMLKKMRYKNGNVFITTRYGQEHSIVGQYLETTSHPCETPEALDRYRFPDMSHPIYYQEIRMYRMMNRDAAIVAAAPGIQDGSQMYMGMENLFVWIVEYPEVVERFFKRFAEHSLQVIRGSLRAGADIVMIADDYGTQDRMFMSKAMWERFTFPCLKMQCEEIHRRGGTAMLHSCGYVQPLLDKIVEAGVDILQAFQPSAGNDLKSAKQEFGDELCFMTGLDVQQLPKIGPREVRESILESVRTGAEGGGYILGTTNALQVDTPTANLKEMFRTIKDIWKGNY